MGVVSARDALLQVLGLKFDHLIGIAPLKICVAGPPSCLHVIDVMTSAYEGPAALEMTAPGLPGSAARLTDRTRSRGGSGDGVTQLTII